MVSGWCNDLVVFTKHRDSLSELLLLQCMKTETGLVQQEDGSSEVVQGLRAEYHEEGDQSAKALASLIQFDFHADVVHDHDLEVLAVRH